MSPDPTSPTPTQMAPSMLKHKGSWGQMWPTPSAQEPGWKNIKVVDKDGNVPTHYNQRFYDKKTGRVVQKGLQQVAQMWPTPTGMTGGEGVAPSHKDGKHGWNTAAAVNDAQSPTPTRMWPTPRVSSANGVAQSEVDKGDPKRRLEVTVQVEQPQTTGKLNPKWVAWLMGYPTEYLNSVPWETRSSRKSQRK